MSLQSTSDLLWLSAVITVGMQLMFFAIAWTCQIDKVTDIAGSMNFVLIAWVTFLISGSYYTRQIVLLVFVNLWGFRLGLFLLYRVLRRGKDERFDEIRAKFWSFFGFWVYQMFWAWIVSLPITFVMGARVDVGINALDWVGWSFWLIGYYFEAVADYTKQMHYEDESTRSTFLKTSVWGVSRHPNYFGEIMCWAGIFLSSAAVYSHNTSSGYVSVLSPVFTAFLLLFVSGIPLGEERYDRKFGHLQEYIEYKRSTSPLIPMPNALYRSLPNFAKLFCCLELPMYNKVELGASKKQQQQQQQHAKVKDGSEHSADEQDRLTEHNRNAVGYQSQNS